MLDGYYAARGWTRDGIPTKNTLTELGLESIIQSLTETEQ